MLPVIRRHRAVPTTTNDFDRFFDWAFGDAAPSMSGWTPAVDVEETDDNFLVTAELPGLTADDVEVTVENGVLTISGEKSDQRENGSEKRGRHVVERRYGRFVRNFSLPRSVDPDGVTARFENGLLQVTLPKANTAKARRIKVS